MIGFWGFTCQGKDETDGVFWKFCFQYNGEALSVRGRIDNKSNNGNRGKSSNGYKGRSKSHSKGDKFCNCKKDNHFITECYKLKNKEKRAST